MTAREMSIGDRGEELLGWLWRLGGLTASQYAALAEAADPEMVMKGAASRGNRWGRNGRPKPPRQEAAKAAPKEETGAAAQDAPRSGPSVGPFEGGSEGTAG